MGLKVYTGGTFDLFHAGHVNFLKRCSEIGSVTVALNTDDFIAQYKGKYPWMTLSERRAVLEACRWVDEVVVNRFGADSKPTIEELEPDVVAIGSDWARKDYYKQMQFTQDWLDSKNISLLYIPYTEGISSTELKERARDRIGL